MDYQARMAIMTKFRKIFQQFHLVLEQKITKQWKPMVYYIKWESLLRGKRGGDLNFMAKLASFIFLLC